MLFLIVSVVVFNLVAFLIPKRLSRPEIWTTMLFAALLQGIVDLYADVKYNLYGYFQKGIQWECLIVFFGIYPAISTIFLNYYPFSKSIFSKALYVLGWTIFALLYEVMALKSGYFYYHGWHLWYSAPCYPVLLCILVWHLKFVRKLNVKA